VFFYCKNTDKVIDISLSFDTVAAEISKLIDDFTAPKKKKTPAPIVVTPNNDSLDVSFFHTIKFEVYTFPLLYSPQNFC